MLNGDNIISASSTKHSYLSPINTFPQIVLLNLNIKVPSFVLFVEIKFAILYKIKSNSSSNFVILTFNSGCSLMTFVVS